ncbi:MAG: response regulator [Candidatus Binatia bacterium]
MSTVLTVDDSKVVRSMVTRHLQPYGCTIVEATNGQEGVEMARTHQPDLVLLDVTMPVMDGLQALAELRKDEATKKIPVIMLTAESGRDLVVEIAKLGVNGYIVKPFQQDTFEKEVSKVLGAPGAAAGAQGATAVDPRAVLIVDDSEKVLAMAKAALEHSLTVLTATSGKDALAQYAKARPAVVVIDLVMPDMDGFATLAELQKLGKSSCVALAVRGDASLHERAKKAGYTAIVDKPFQPGELLEQVLQAGNAGASPEDVLKEYVGEDGGCPVFNLPNPSSKMLAKLLPIFGKKLRALAEDGNDKLILDVAQLSDVTSEQVAMLVRLLTEAGTLGIRTAICAPDQQIVTKLQQIAETREARYAATRDAARQCLQ